MDKGGRDQVAPKDSVLRCEKAQKNERAIPAVKWDTDVVTGVAAGFFFFPINGGKIAKHLLCAAFLERESKSCTFLLLYL